MAIIQSGVAASTLLTVDPAFAAARITPRPYEQLGTYAVAGASGALVTTVNSPATNPIFCVRWNPSGSANFMVLQSLRVSGVVNTAITTSQEFSLGMAMIRGFSSNETTNITSLLSYGAQNTSNNTKYRTAMTNSAFVTTSAGSTSQIAVATTANMTGGTRTVDTNYLSIISTSSGTAVGTNLWSAGFTSLYEYVPGAHPIVLTSNEGVGVYPVGTTLATGTVRLYFSMTWAEVSAY
jgi:hypothetical protein